MVCSLLSSSVSFHPPLLFPTQPCRTLPRLLARQILLLAAGKSCFAIVVVLANRSQAHVCVSTTARVGAELGFDVVLAEDAIGDRDIPGASGADVTKMVMLELNDAFGSVTNVASIG